MTISERVEAAIVTVFDFPKTGIQFKDLTPVLANADLFSDVTDELSDVIIEYNVVAGIEARGFAFGAAVAIREGIGFVPMRKKGKLPCATVSVTYALEYGDDMIEAVGGDLRGRDVLVVDDVLATGGTAEAAADLVRQAGGRVAGFSFVLEIVALKGRERLEKLARVKSVLRC